MDELLRLLAPPSEWCKTFVRMNTMSMHGCFIRSCYLPWAVLLPQACATDHPVIGISLSKHFCRLLEGGIGRVNRSFRQR